VTISGGVAAGAGEVIRYDQLFRDAHDALLRAKRRGRDRVEMAGDLPPVPLLLVGESDGERRAART
jgi:hypothetical protein